MNPYVLAALARERERELQRARLGAAVVRSPWMRLAIARALRASGDRLFRLGVALDARVAPAPRVSVVARETTKA